MRFLMLTTFYPPWSFGGDAQMVHALSHALVEQGHDVTVAHSVESYRLLEGGRSPLPSRAYRDDRGVSVVAIDHGLGPLAPVASYLTGRPALMRRRLQHLLQQHYDVVHFHNPSLLGAPRLFCAGDSLKLLTLHEYWLVCPMNVLTRNQKELCMRPTCVRCSIAHHRPPQPWRYTSLLHRSIGGLDALLAPSEFSARRHVEFRSRVRIECVANFVHPDPRGDPSGGNFVPSHFLYVGRLEPMKGVERLLPVFAERPNDDLVIVGKGSQEPRLRHLAEGLNNVRLTGKLEPAEIDHLYRQASAVLMPTIGQEACPLVFLEAQARGVPVVASDHGALREMVQAGGGLLFANAEGLHSAVDRLATNPALRSELGRRARARYLSEWTRATHLRRYFALISDLALTRGDRRLSHEARAAGNLG